MRSKVDFNRVIKLIKQELISNQKFVVLFSVSILVINIILSSLFSLDGPETTYVPHIAVIIVMLSILTSFSFYELDNPEQGIFYLNFPATNFEKYLSRWILTLLGYLIIGIIIYLVVCIYVYLLNSSQSNFTISRPNYSLLNPANVNFISSLSSYIFFHSLFFFGAIFFKKNEAVKSIISLVVLIFLFYAILFLLHRIIIPDLSITFFLNPNYGGIVNYQRILEFQDYKKELFSFVINFLKYLVPPLLWLLGYFRLKEEEV